MTTKSAQQEAKIHHTTGRTQNAWNDLQRTGVAYLHGWRVKIVSWADGYACEVTDPDGRPWLHRLTEYADMLAMETAHYLARCELAKIGERPEKYDPEDHDHIRK